MTQPALPRTMHAVVLDRFGDADELAVRTIPVPQLDANDVLIRTDFAGVGEWDLFEREGGYARMLGLEPRFPYILGSECSGTVMATGDQVSGHQRGDRVFATAFLNAKGGLYAEFAVVNAGLVAAIPAGLTPEQASVMSGVGVTALRGLEDVLSLQNDESVLILGASGGVGHLAAQLALHRGARVLAVASGSDGVALVRRLGIEAVVDGREDDVDEAMRAFAPDGLDAALLTAGGPAAERALQGLRPGGRVAYPNGVEVHPDGRTDIALESYNGDPDTEIIARLNARMNEAPIQVHVSRIFPLKDAAEAHRAMEAHHLGKMALRVRDFHGG